MSDIPEWGKALLRACAVGSDRVNSMNGKQLSEHNMRINSIMASIAVMCPEALVESPEEILANGRRYSSMRINEAYASKKSERKTLKYYERQPSKNVEEQLKELYAAQLESAKKEGICK